MAQQAILRAQRHRHAKENDAANLGGMPKEKSNVLTTTLRKRLKANSDKLYQLFSIWDEDESGAIDEREFRRAIVMLGLKPTNEDFQELCRLVDADSSGTIDLQELTSLIEMTPEELQTTAPGPAPSLPKRALNAVYQFISLLWVQALLYFAFVVIFQNLTDTLRQQEEYYLDKMFSDTFVTNHFDASHNTFEAIRRVADVWEWGNNVLWPGLLGNSGPDCGEVGASAVFNSASHATVDLNEAGTLGNRTLLKGGCNDDGWPDGEGSFHARDRTAWTVEDLVHRMNAFDWTAGMIIWQSRAQPQPAHECDAKTIGGLCFAEAMWPYKIDESEFGYNWTHPGEPLAHPWRHFTAAESGGNPRTGGESANPVSLHSYPPGGFLSIVLPFFADTYLPSERGFAPNVTVHTKQRLDPSPPHAVGGCSPLPTSLTSPPPHLPPSPLLSPCRLYHPWLATDATALARVATPPPPPAPPRPFAFRRTTGQSPRRSTTSGTRATSACASCGMVTSSTSCATRTSPTRIGPRGSCAPPSRSTGTT